MAQMQTATVFSGDSAITRPYLIMSAESAVELAKNSINPVKCEWGVGTKAECNIVLGSWKLLQKVSIFAANNLTCVLSLIASSTPKHLHIIHSHPSKVGI